jgi:hypothetical protein
VSPLAISLLVFVCIAGAGLLGMVVGQRLPEHHLRQESKDAIKQGLAVIATLAALVLGLLVASAKGGYDTQTNAVRQLAADILLLDHVLALYGPETKEARAVLHHGVAATLDHIWPEDTARGTDLTPGEARADMEIFYDKIGRLEPQNDAQRALKARALDITAGLAQTRLRLFAQKDGSIPTPFLVVLVFWLVILLGGCGLMAPRNGTVTAFLAVCALSVSGALFLVLELDTPFDGLMRISSAPLREALSRLGN